MNRLWGGALILVVFLVVSAVNVPDECSAVLTVRDKSLVFMRDVLLLDLDSYNVTVESTVGSPSSLGGVPMEDLRYTLEAEGSRLEVSLNFRNKTFNWCKLSVVEGLPLYVQTPSLDVLDEVKGFIDRYKDYRGTSDYQGMRDVLDKVTEIKSTTVTGGDTRLTLSVYPELDDISFSWSPIKGTGFSAIHLSIRKGCFNKFKDNLDLYEFGSTDWDSFYWHEGVAAEFSAWERSFLAEVVKLDMTEYNATKYIGEYKCDGYFDDYRDLPREEGDYVLQANGSEIEVSYIQVNHTYRWFSLYVKEGSPTYTQQPSTDLLERADNLLKDYQSFLDTQEFQKYRNILSTVNEIKETLTTGDNVRLEIKDVTSQAGDPRGTAFRWINMFNGADYTSFSISYRNNGEFAFGDDRYYQIGSTDLVVSREEAVEIAMNRVENMSWTVEGEEVGNVTVLENKTSVGLKVATREPLVLYPYWLVSLTFDRVYNGNVYGVTYNIWADTGEVYYGHMHLFGGSPDDYGDPIPEFPSWAVLILMLGVVTAVMITYSRRSEKAG